MTGKQHYKYLYGIDSPADLKRLSPAELRDYCGELRGFIVEQLSENPGHLGASLGTVELAVALHYVFDTPYDKLVWDVGHQAYAHKIITGRRDLFGTNRRLGGLSGFPRPDESPYDTTVAGHASASISSALGIAEAARIAGEKRDVVAVIGDGALTGGLAFEGLNNAGASNANLLVILNDNDISIDPNVGAMKEYLLGISTSRRYNAFKESVWRALARTPRLRRMIQKTGNALKQGVLQQSNLFESLNFRYFGPVDGHDIAALVRVLQDLRELPGPKLLHILTVKGKGYRPAENDQSLWHAPGKFNPETGELLSKEPAGAPPRYQDVFGETLLEMALEDPRIVGVTPAMPTGCSMNLVMERLPGRCFDVGIAEGHAVTFSAGLATGGLLPFCNIYSSFAQRAYDNVIHDVAIANLDVVLCLDRAGIVGEDGPTHHGVFDIASLRPIPNLTLAAPMDGADLRRMMYTAARGHGAFVIRYPRGRNHLADWRVPLEAIEVGRARILREGTDVALLSLGAIGNNAAEAAARAEGISVLHADLRFAKPLDEALLHRVGRDFRHVITVEDGVAAGGVGSAVAEFMEREGYSCRVHILGIGDEFVTHGTISELHALSHLDTPAILGKIREVIL